MADAAAYLSKFSVCDIICPQLLQNVQLSKSLPSGTPWPPGIRGTPYATRPCQRGAESVVVRRLKVTGRCVQGTLPLPRAAPLCQMQLAAGAAGRVGTLSCVWCPRIPKPGFN